LLEKVAFSFQQGAGFQPCQKHLKVDDGAAEEAAEKVVMDAKS
jgi:hypothetical protein